MKDIRILKRGKSYMSIRADSLSFKDLILFTSPCTLDKYLKTWGSNAEKLIYPYSHFPTIESMEECVEFPTIEDFKVDKDVDPDMYQKCKANFINVRKNFHQNSPFFTNSSISC